MEPAPYTAVEVAPAHARPASRCTLASCACRRTCATASSASPSADCGSRLRRRRHAPADASPSCLAEHSRRRPSRRPGAASRRCVRRRLRRRLRRRPRRRRREAGADDGAARAGGARTRRRRGLDAESERRPAARRRVPAELPQLRAGDAAHPQLIGKDALVAAIRLLAPLSSEAAAGRALSCPSWQRRCDTTARLYHAACHHAPRHDDAAAAGAHRCARARGS